MATLEDEIKHLKDEITHLKKGNMELVQKVQYWKVAAANKENEKLELMKEINELRMKQSRLRSGGAAQARKLDAELQSASEEALTHLVKASSAVARSIDLVKTYMQDRQDLANSSPRWSAIGGTPNSDKVHRVPPLLIGGQSIQPVVSLSRTLFNPSSNSHSRSITLSRSPNQNRSLTERAVPMHMLQDVYIPLTRIDMSDMPGNNMETETDSNDMEDSAEDLSREDSGERSIDDSQNINESSEFEPSQRLESVAEDLELEHVDETPPRSRTDNPLEGPSWLLDRPSVTKSRRNMNSKTNLEPDSTTQVDENSVDTPPLQLGQINEDEAINASIVAASFSPTVRRRKRAAPHALSLSPILAPQATFSPRPAASRRNSNSGRVLKVLVAKMRLDSDSDSDSNDATPPKRAALALSSPSPSPSPNKRQSRDVARNLSPTNKMMRFDAPSPNGATDARVIVSQSGGSGEPMQITANQRESPVSSQDSRKSKPDCGDGQTVMGLGDGQTHTKDGQNRLADQRLGRGRKGTKEINMEERNDDIMVLVSQRGGSVEDRRTNYRASNKRGNEEPNEPHSKSGESSNARDTMVTESGNRLDSMDHTSRMGSVGIDGRDSDSSTDQVAEGRTRRPRKQVTYKEKPLKGKLRR